MCDVEAKIRLRQSMRIFVNIPTKFHPDLIWKDGALGFYEEGRPNKNTKNNNNKMSRILIQFLITQYQSRRNYH